MSVIHQMLQDLQQRSGAAPSCDVALEHVPGVTANRRRRTPIVIAASLIALSAAGALHLRAEGPRDDAIAAANPAAQASGSFAGPTLRHDSHYADRIDRIAMTSTATGALDGDAARASDAPVPEVVKAAPTPQTAKAPPTAKAPRVEHAATGSPASASPAPTKPREPTLVLASAAPASRATAAPIANPVPAANPAPVANPVPIPNPVPVANPAPHAAPVVAAPSAPELRASIERRASAAAAPLGAEDRYRAALARYNAGNAVEAIAMLRAALQQQATHQGARKALVAILIERGERAAALATLDEALRIDPRQHELALLSSRLALASGHSDDAIRTLLAASGADAPAELSAALAALLGKARRDGDAIAHWLAAIKRSPQRAPWWLGLAVSLESDGRRGEALAAYDRALSFGTLSADTADFARGRVTALR